MSHHIWDEGVTNMMQAMAIFSPGSVFLAKTNACNGFRIMKNP